MNYCCTNCGRPFKEREMNAGIATCPACAAINDFRENKESRRTERREEDETNAAGRVERATVHIVSVGTESSSSGTGFLVSHDGERYLVTNCHVIENALRGGGFITAAFSEEVNPRKDGYSATPLAVDQLNDVALLELDVIPEKAVCLELADLSTLKKAQKVVTVGCPRIFEFNALTGTVVNAKCDANGDGIPRMSRILCNLSATHGNSGGGVVRIADEKVVGIATGVFSGDFLPNHTLCASAGAIRQLIARYGKSKNKSE